MKVKQRLSFVLFCALCLQLSAETPVLKIDVNVDEARKEEEVNEPGYLPWKLGKGIMSDTATFEGVQFTISCVESTGGQLRGSWAKVMVQSPNFARLTCDGANVDYGSQTVEAGGKLLLEIAGLPVGTHTLQTVHNSWQDPATKAPSPMNVYLDSVLVHEAVSITSRALVASEATTLLTIFQVTTEGQVVKLLFEAVPSFTPPTGVSPNYNVWLNAIELNTVDLSKLSRNPWPVDADMHVDADSGSLTLSWSPASAMVEKHYLFLGTDKALIENADTTDTALLAAVNASGDTTFLMTDPYSLHTYYWRVDELDENGVLTKGNVWSFRPRQLAFRGAEGYGRFATGGRGGKVVYVTNLNDAGAGSFREAVTSDIGPRTVVFNVSGIIPLSDKIFCDENITIAGQTAPGKGICLRTSSLAIDDESIARFIRMRLGSGTSTDGMGLPGADHSILDHCSVSWSIDEGLTSRNAGNITVQRVLVSEALNQAGLHDDPNRRHGFAAVFGGDVSSVHHNLLAHNSGRNPRFDGGMDGLNYYKGRVDFFNNVVYNWNAHAAYGEAHEVQFVNNYYKQGPATSKTTIFNADVNQRQTNLGTETYYTTGNLLELKNKTLFCDGTNNSCGMTSTIHGTMVIDWDIFVDKPFFPSFTEIETAKSAYKSVLSNVGCNLPLADNHDQRMVSETLNGTYSCTGSLTGLPGIIDHELDAGGYEDYGNEARPESYDTDWDGLPDWWETLYGSNPQSVEGDFSDANADPDRDGFTALDDYLEWMANPHYYTGINTAKTIDLSPYTVGYTKSPVYSLSSVSHGATVSFAGSMATVTPTATFKGILYMDFTVTDSEGSQSTRRIGLLVDETDPTHLHPTVRNQVHVAIEGETLHLQSDRAICEVVMYDLTGRCVLQEKAETIRTININDLNNGMYVLSLKNSDKQQAFVKFIK